MSARLVVTIAAPVALRLRTHWRGALAVLVLGVLADALLTPSRSLAHAGRSPVPALALPDDAKKRLLALTPGTYVGLAGSLAKRI